MHWVNNYIKHYGKEFDYYSTLIKEFSKEAPGKQLSYVCAVIILFLTDLLLLDFTLFTKEHYKHLYVLSVFSIILWILLEFIIFIIKRIINSNDNDTSFHKDVNLS